MARKKKKRVESVPSRPLPTHRLDQKLRGLPLDAERALRRRQFENFNHHKVKVFDDEFSPQNAREAFARVDGTPAHIRERISGKPLSAASRFHSDLREKPMPGLHLYFQDEPENVNVCRARNVRRAVLFALRRTGRGSAKGKKHNWTEESKVRCV